MIREKRHTMALITDHAPAYGLVIRKWKHDLHTRHSIRKHLHLNFFSAFSIHCLFSHSTYCRDFLEVSDPISHPPFYSISTSDLAFSYDISSHLFPSSIIRARHQPPLLHNLSLLHVNRDASQTSICLQGSPEN